MSEILIPEPVLDSSNKSLSSQYLYHAKEILTSPGYGKAIMVPGGDVTSVGIDLEGDGSVQFTVYSEEDVKSNAAIWRDWDGSSLINPAITFIRQKNTTGTTRFMVSMR